MTVMARKRKTTFRDDVIQELANQGVKALAQGRFKEFLADLLGLAFLILVVLAALLLLFVLAG